jgi:hypothetical protein
MDPNKNLYQLIESLESRVKVLEEENINFIESLESKIKVLEEENVSLTNELYRLECSLDARIDILMEKTLWKIVSES